MKKTIILLMASIGFFSCVEDEGNYNYTLQNEITIEGLEDSYNLLNKVDTLKITPTIKGSILGDNLDNYEYQWHIHEGVDEHKHTFISDKKDLEYLVDLGIGTYSLYFTVKDKTTGLEATASSSITTSTAISKGFLVLGDDVEEGIMGLDMIVMPPGRDTTVAENVYNNSETRFKGADRILWQGYRYGMVNKESIWMCTDDGSFRMDHHPGVFSVISELSDYQMIETEFEHKPMRIKDVTPHPYYSGGTASCASSTYRAYMTEDMFFMGNTTTLEYYTTPGNRLSNTATTMFNFYPCLFYSETAYNAYLNSYIVYNTDEDRFMKTYFNGTKITHCVDAGFDLEGEEFPWNQKSVGRTIVWGGNAMDSQGHSYALMKDQNGNYFLYKFLVSSQKKVKCFNIDLSAAPNFANASHYMVSATNSILLYTYGSKLCMYNYAYDTNNYKEYDMEAEITCLEAEYMSRGSRTAIIIATYDDDEKGIIRKFDVGTNPNVLELIERPNDVWKTRLRVKDIEWKSN